MPEEKLQEMKQELKLLNVEETSQVTGWGIEKIRQLMNEDDEFPVIKIGKSNQVSFEALKEYIRHRRIKRGE